ncbi:carbohydrate ABC transporter permease [Paenibacillus sp. GCM10027628]|uniref:carbohydrate ABC transporter permease n=1 Tax=Paenibacillus sp. GCM10027628 TaxID=3273413 RepID=UPI003632901C
MKRKDYIWGYLMVAPMMIGLSVLFIWPIFRTTYFSFTDWGDFGRYRWTGMRNYVLLIRDPAVYRAFLHTLEFVALYVPILVIFSTLLAVLLNQKIRGVAIYRTLYFLPVVLMPAAVGLAWKWLLNGEYGLINQLLAALHVDGLSWLTDSRTALLSVAAVAVWSMIGFQAVILLSGLKGISATYYEAAAIEGAGVWAVLSRITLPLLTPTLFFVTVTSLISAFQLFDLVYMMIGQVAIEHADTIVYLFYKQAFQLNAKGYASAVATVLFIVVLLLTALQMKLQKRWVHYD